MAKSAKEIQDRLNKFNQEYKESGLTDGKILSMVRYENNRINGKDPEFLKRSFMSPEAKAKGKASQIERYGSVQAVLHTPKARAKAFNTREKKYGSINGNMMTPEANAKKIERYGSINGAMMTPEVRAKAVAKFKKRVLQYDLENNFIREWPSSADAGRELKINPGDIGACCREKQKTAKGFIWKFA